MYQISQFILKKAWFNAFVGQSTVIIEYKGKTYEGHAKLNPADKDFASKFTGCRYAELRAEIAALKDEYKHLKANCEECRKFVKACEGYANFDSDSPSARAMYRQLNRRIKEVNELATIIGKFEFNLKTSLRMQDKLISKL